MKQHARTQLGDNIAADMMAHLYATRDGRQLRGQTVSSLAGDLRWKGWKGLGRKFSDPHFIREQGLEVVEAQYINGAHPTGRFVDTVVKEWK